MKLQIKSKAMRNLVSLSTIIYMGYLALTIIFSFLYDFIYPSTIVFFIFHMIINLAFLYPMFLTRKTKLTTICSGFFLLLTFFILIFEFGNFLLIIPPFLVSAIIFFSSKCTETAKTVIGTLYFLVYVIGIIAFILVSSFFGSSIVPTTLTEKMSSENPILKVYTQEKIDTVLANSVSPDGKLRYKLIDMDNSLEGKLTLIVEPNNKDKSYLFFKLRETACSKDVGFIMGRGDSALPTVEWKNDNTITYQFPGQEQKTSVIKDEDVEKDYFEFAIK